MLRLRYHYQQALSGGDAEQPGQLHFYVGGGDQQPTVIHDGRKRAASREIVVPWRFREGNVPSADSTFNVEAFSFVHNAAGDWCLSPAGQLTVPMRELQPGNYDLTIPQAEGMKKGEWMVEELEWTGPPFSEFSLEIGNVQQATTEIQSYIAARQHFLDVQMEPTWPVMRHVRVPVYVCGSFVLPGLAYALTPRAPGVDPRYYRNALEVVLRRQGLSNEKFLQASPAVVGEILGDVCVLYASTCTYLTDKAVSRQLNGEAVDVLIEHFGLEPARNAGDCEDGALVCLHNFLDLKSTSFKDPTLQRLHEAAQHYLGFLMLKGVTSPALVQSQPPLGSAVDDSKVAGAHMDCMLIPRQTFLGFLSHSVPKEELVAVQAVLGEGEDTDWPILVCEPTGLLASAGVNSAQPPLHRVRQVLSRLPGVSKSTLRQALEGIRVLSVQPREEESPFYKTVQMAYTPELFWKGIPLVQFTFVQPQTQTYSVGFQDVVNGNVDAVELLPAPALTETMTRTLTQVLRQGYPMPVFHPPRAKNRTRALPVLSALRSFVGNWMQPSSTKPFDLYFRYDQLSPERIRALGRVMSALQSHAHGVELRHEPVRENVGNVVVRVFVQ